MNAVHSASEYCMCGVPNSTKDGSALLLGDMLCIKFNTHC